MPAPSSSSARPRRRARVQPGRAQPQRGTRRLAHHPRRRLSGGYLGLAGRRRRHGAASSTPVPGWRSGRPRRRSPGPARAAVTAWRWREVLVVGRSGEAAGWLRSRLAVDRAGRALLRHGLGTGDGLATSPAVLGDQRVVAMVLTVDPATGPPAPASAGEGWAAAPLHADGRLVIAVGSDLPAVYARLEEAGEAGGPGGAGGCQHLVGAVEVGAPVDAQPGRVEAAQGAVAVEHHHGWSPPATVRRGSARCVGRTPAPRCC